MKTRPRSVVYVRLEENGFRELVAGKVVELKNGAGETVKLILADIGWVRMLAAVHDARLGQAKGEQDGEGEAAS